MTGWLFLLNAIVFLDHRFQKMTLNLNTRSVWTDVPLTCSPFSQDLTAAAWTHPTGKAETLILQAPNNLCSYLLLWKPRGEEGSQTADILKKAVFFRCFKPFSPRSLPVLDSCPSLETQLQPPTWGRRPGPVHHRLPFHVSIHAIPPRRSCLSHWPVRSWGWELETGVVT